MNIENIKAITDLLVVKTELRRIRTSKDYIASYEHQSAMDDINMDISNINKMIDEIQFEDRKG